MRICSLILEREETAEERERNIYLLPLVCIPAGDGTHSPLVYGTMLNQLSHPARARYILFSMVVSAASFYLLSSSHFSVFTRRSTIGAHSHGKLGPRPLVGEGISLLMYPFKTSLS